MMYQSLVTTKMMAPELAKGVNSLEELNKEEGRKAIVWVDAVSPYIEIVKPLKEMYRKGRLVDYYR